MKPYALFTGCFIPAKLPWLEKASVAVLKKLEAEPKYLEFSCCPNTHMKSMDEETWLAIAARNLAIAEKENLDIIALCSGCSGTLLDAKHLLQDDEKREEVNKELKKIGLSYEGKNDVRHIVNFIHENMDKAKELIQFPMKMNVAIHDGCHIQRPSDIMDYSTERTDDLLKMLGLEVVEYPHRDLCCGSALAAVDQEITNDLVEFKLNELKESGADALCTPCPLCLLQYETAQRRLEMELPVFYYPELLAIAFGFHPNELGVQYHQVNTEAVIKKCLGLG